MIPAFRDDTLEVWIGDVRDAPDQAEAFPEVG